VGTLELTPAAATVAVHERLTYTLTWTGPPPLNWHNLESVQLRISASATLNLHDSRVQGSGPTGPSVTLTLDVSFKPPAAGLSYLVEVLATDDAGHEQIQPAGTLTVVPPSHRMT
jgi:hypothetical protein